MSDSSLGNDDVPSSEESSGPSITVRNESTTVENGKIVHDMLISHSLVYLGLIATSEQHIFLLVDTSIDVFNTFIFEITQVKDSGGFSNLVRKRRVRRKNHPRKSA